MQELPDDAPVMVILPGLTGGSHDTYVQHMVGTAHRQGIRAVVFNSRGTSDAPVTTPQFYSASFTGDMKCVFAVPACSCTALVGGILRSSCVFLHCVGRWDTAKGGVWEACLGV